MGRVAEIINPLKARLARGMFGSSSTPVALRESIRILDESSQRTNLLYAKAEIITQIATPLLSLFGEQLSRKDFYQERFDALELSLASLVHTPYSNRLLDTDEARESVRVDFEKKAADQLSQLNGRWNGDRVKRLAERIAPDFDKMLQLGIMPEPGTGYRDDNESARVRSRLLWLPYINTIADKINLS